MEDWQVDILLIYKQLASAGKIAKTWYVDCALLIANGWKYEQQISNKLIHISGLHMALHLMW